MAKMNNQLIMAMIQFANVIKTYNIYKWIGLNNLPLIKIKVINTQDSNINNNNHAIIIHQSIK